MVGSILEMAKLVRNALVEGPKNGKRKILCHNVARSDAGCRTTEHHTFVPKSGAYRCLKARGLSDDGSVLQFFGIIKTT